MSSKNVPKLRFPEFLDLEGWSKKKLGNICNVLQGYGFPEVMQGKQNGRYPFCKVSDISKAVNENGGFLDRASNYVDEDDLSILRAKPIQAGTTVFAKIGEALRLNRRAIATVECLIDNNAVGLKAKSELADDYFVFTLSQKIDLNEHCGGAVPSVNKTTLESVGVCCPALPEQQKIANCFASMDDLITTQTQKLDALKAHKKGLMQQLFPAEGETVPKIRFPEFRDKGGWAISGKTWVNNHAHVLKFKNNFTQIIVENYLNSTTLENYLTGMAQPKLNRAKLDIIPIPFPEPKEQQKIADCLSSIDDLISAQTQKLDALKAHKKGLMQQLFPSADEVDE
jgi:restriction endonuclease S subunit